MKKQYAAIFAIGIMLGIVVPLGFNILNAKLMNLYLSEIYKEVTTDEKNFVVNISFMRIYIIDEDNQTLLSLIYEENISDFLDLSSFPYVGNWTVDVDIDFTTFKIPVIFPEWQINHFSHKDYYVLFHGDYLPWDERRYSYWVNGSTIDFQVGYKSDTLADFYNISKLYFNFFF